MAAKKSKPKAKVPASKPAAPFAQGDTVRVLEGGFGNARGVVEIIDAWPARAHVRIGRELVTFSWSNLALVAKATPRA